jgi:hypothetical protein
MWLHNEPDSEENKYCQHLELLGYGASTLLSAPDAPSRDPGHDPIPTRSNERTTANGGRADLVSSRIVQAGLVTCLKMIQKEPKQYIAGEYFRKGLNPESAQLRVPGATSSLIPFLFLLPLDFHN